MNHREYDASALLALPKIKEGSTPEQGLKTWSRPFLIDEVRRRGVDVAVVRGAASLDVESGQAFDVARPQYDNEGVVTLHNLGAVGLSSFNMMRSIVRPVEVDGILPVLNPTAIRRMARDKYTMANDLYVPAGAYDRQLGIYDPTQETADIDAVLDTISGDFVVAKPNGGLRSIGVLVGEKAEVARRMQSVEVPYIVEEKLDFSAPLPEIRGLDESEQRRLDEANAAGVNKEVRLYYFGDGSWDGVARVARPGEVDFRDDKWLQIDLDSVPSELVQKGNDIIARIREKIGTDEVNVALDWVYASSASQPEPRWQIMELNAAEPQLVQLTDHEDVGRRQHRKLATQIARIAVN